MPQGSGDGKMLLCWKAESDWDQAQFTFQTLPWKLKPSVDSRVPKQLYQTDSASNCCLGGETDSWCDPFYHLPRILSVWFLKELPYCLSQWMHHCIFLTAMPKGFSFSNVLKHCFWNILYPHQNLLFSIIWIIATMSVKSGSHCGFFCFLFFFFLHFPNE